MTRAVEAVKKRSPIERFFVRANRALRGRVDGYLARRPHRSFRRTRRRDYDRSFALPGYLPFTRDVFRVIFTHKRLFGAFFAAYTVASGIILGVISQANYAQIADALQKSTDNGFLQTISLFGVAITGGLGPSAAANSGILSTLLILLAWLTVVWLLRSVVNGQPVRLRDGLYNAGGPIIPMALVSLVIVVQAIPLMLVLIGYNAAAATGLLAGGVETMLFVAVAALLTALSVYWLISTFIALVVVTLPGMSPLAALRAAGDLVTGRRLRLILRMLWLGVVIVLVWAVIVIPVILLANLINIAWLPLVPGVVLGMTTFTLILVATYIYLLYRKLVEDGAKPA